MMPAYKLKGIVDTNGNLAIASPINIPPGEVEIIVLQLVETVENKAVAESEPKAETPQKKVQYRTKVFRDLTC